MGREATEIESPAQRGLGDVLVACGILAPQALADSVRAQLKDHIPLDRRLLTAGVVTRRDLLEALDDVWGVPAIDLMVDPPDPELMRAIPRELLRAPAVGAHITSSHLARSSWRRPKCPTAELEEPRSGNAGRLRSGDCRVDLHLITTGWDLTQALLGVLPSEMVEQAAEALASARPELSAELGWARWQRNAVAGRGARARARAPGVGFAHGAASCSSHVNVMFFVGVSFKIVAVHRRDASRRSDRARAGNHQSCARGATLRPEPAELHDSRPAVSRGRCADACRRTRPRTRLPDVEAAGPRAARAR